jgi:ankyrin repeat protein
MMTGGYKPELDFNLLDLSEKDRKMLLDKKPSLEYTNEMFENYIIDKDWMKIIAMTNNGFVYKDYKTIDKNDLIPFLDLVKKQKASVKGLERYLGFFKACEDGDLEIVKLLIDNGADVTSKDNMSIRWASREGHLEVVKYLIDNGADVTAQDNYAIRWASFNGHLEVVELLKKHGAVLESFKIKNWKQFNS